MVDVVSIVSRVIRVGKAVAPLAIAKMNAFACSKCSTLASVSLLDNKITIKKCRCV